MLLDAACGTGKYWPTILAAGRRVVGVDRSAGMLTEVARKHPAAVTHHFGLQELVTHDELDGGFDGLLCVDALECVPPEEWPQVLEGFVRVLSPGAPLYLTVEQPSDGGYGSPSGEPEAPLVAGEVLGPEDRGTRGYHFYPTDEQVDRWLADAQIVRLDTEVADCYRHILARRA